MKTAIIFGSSGLIGNELFNIGNNSLEHLMDVVALIEKSLGRKAKIIHSDIQPGDVEKTFADIEYSEKKLGYSPVTKIKEGIPKFVSWYNKYINFVNKD